MKMDGDGKAVWQKTIPGSVGGFSAALPTADGGYVVVGSTSTSQDNLTSVRVLKIGSDGSSPDCANLARYDRGSGDMGVITGNVPTVAVATEVVPAIGQFASNASSATMVESCGAAAN
jgi:hypothetical protein